MFVHGLMCVPNDEMDHSYSKERDRMQKTDHCYFTLGKKTPQVVLRRAQQLKEQTHGAVKSSIGQDHSYVRAEHGINTCSFDAELVQEIGASVQAALSFDCKSECSQSTTCKDEVQQSDVSLVSLSSSEESRMNAAEALLTLDSTTLKSSVMDDLRSWIGSIQLDHTYGGQQSYSITEGEYNLNDAEDCEYKISFPSGISWCVSHHQLDHAYENKLDRHRWNCVSCDFSHVVPRDIDFESDRQAVDNSVGEIDKAQNCAIERMLGCKDFISDGSTLQFRHSDHVYDANVCELTSPNEFRSDHSYGIKRNRGNCDSQDWWDHAYVNCEASGPSWGSCSRDVGLASPIVDLVAGAMV